MKNVFLWLVCLVVLWPWQGNAVAPGPPPDPGTNLCSWSFTDTTNWTSDNGYPISFKNLNASNLGNGTALVLDTNVPAWIQYNIVENDGTTNLTLDKGTIMLWFAPTSWAGTNSDQLGTGPGQWGRLLEVGSYTPDASYGLWSLYTDDGGGNLYFSSQDDQGNSATYLSAPLSWSTNRWHHIALTYSATNVSLFLDGALATNAPAGISFLPGPDALTNGLFILSDSTGLLQARGMVDDIATWDYPLDPDSIASIYASSSFPYYMNPENAANCSPQIASAPPSYQTNAPVFRAFMGVGYLQYIGASGACTYSSNIWITDVSAKEGTNKTTSITFSVNGGSPGVLYDVYGTDRLVGNRITNAQWAWLGQVCTCSLYQLADQTNTAIFLVLGTPEDDDLDGLPNAFETLVSKTDPYNPDTYGIGIQDWWGAYYLRTNDFDPYALCPSGDGRTFLQAYQNGWDPNSFYTPPPPLNVMAQLDGNGTNVLITWASGGGPVSNYVILRGTFLDASPTSFWPVGQVSPSTFQYTDNPGFSLIESESFSPAYFIRAYFTNGAFADSQVVSPFQTRLDSQVQLTRGPQGQRYLAVSSVPADLSKLLVYWQKADYSLDLLTIYPTNIINGVALVPPHAMDSYYGAEFKYQLLGTNGGFSPIRHADPYPSNWEEEWAARTLQAFVDARPQLKENLCFLLRAATPNHAFCYASGLDLDGSMASPSPDWASRPEEYYARSESPAGYEYYGFHTFATNLVYSLMQETRPIQENFLWLNYVFDPETLDRTGAGFDYDSSGNGVRLLDMPSLYRYTGTGTEIPLPLALTNALWLYYRWAENFPFDPGANLEVGITLDYNTNFVMAPTVLNRYGLPLVSLRAGSDELVYPGSTFAPLDSPYFLNFAAPELQTVDYYFVSQTPYFNYAPKASGRLVSPPPLPGSPTFSPTNPSPVLIASLGEPITVSAWAKMAIPNGYAGKYAYLEQYFDKAFQMDSNGAVTTNETGILSEYGEFFPTQPGQIALVTKPDIDTGQRGTGIVNVIKLQLDVNHDGIMDLSFAGPDNTSQQRPFVFWINNDHDEPGLPYGQDRDLDASTTPDCAYKDAIFGGRPIHSQRDLEDYARLWIVGVPPLRASDGYFVTLSWSGTVKNPAIQLFESAEAAGGIGYLTDTNVAKAQISWDGPVPHGPGFSIGTVSNTFTFPPDFFTTNANRCLLFDGAGIGSGQLVLTISQATPQGTNVIAQTGVWLDLRDVKDMYEQVHISGVTNTVPPTSGFLSSSYQQLNWVDSSSDQDTNVIVFVHGWRMGVWDYYNFSESMFKRLYWQGYRGRFISIRWDTLSKDDFKFFSTVQAFTTYNSSEFRAWESAKGLSDYLTYLKQERFPNYNLNVCSHSMGGVVMAEALKLQLAAGQRNVNNYVLMQAAVPASCYDASFTNYAPFLAAETSQPTPNTYWGYPGSIGNAVSGHLVDFYNANDYALATGTYGGVPVSWEANQKNWKPDTGFGYTTDGTNCFNARQGYRTVTDSREIISFVARPRSKAVGAQPNVGGVILTTGQVDLKGNFGFDLDWSEHSAEFNWNIQRLGGFYHTLLNTLIPPGQ